MKEVPLLFTAPMILAFLAGEKWQTRRPVNPQPILNYRPELYRTEVDEFGQAKWRYDDPTQPNAIAYVRGPDGLSFIKAKAAARDIIYAKETFKSFPDGDTFFAADFRLPNGKISIPVHADDDPKDWRWMPPIFMPKELARIRRKVLNVRVERLQEITEEDAEAEGADFWFNLLHPDHPEPPSSRTAYQMLWETINGPGSWDANQWVWVYELERKN